MTTNEIKPCDNASDREIMAFMMAMFAHQGQTYQNTAYIMHPIRVVALLRDRGVTDEDVFIVGYLHDVVEDTTMTLDSIRDEWGDRVADAVDAITRRKSDHGKEDETSYLTRVAANVIAKEVKFADMADNLLMTRNPNCPPAKRDLWRKYVNAISFLAGA